MKALIKREYSGTETKGSLSVFGDDDKVIFECKTIELPSKGNKQQVSCIEEGTYECHKVISPSKGKCFSVENVHGRSAVLIHKGNYASGKKVDTQGCILPGMKFADINGDGNIDVAESTVAMDKLLALLPVKFDLTITS
jgi:hypothetical protein